MSQSGLEIAQEIAEQELETKNRTLSDDEMQRWLKEFGKA